MHYVKVTSRTFQSFCVPLIVVAVVVAWVLAIILFKSSVGLTILFGMLLSIVAAAIVIVIYRKQKNGVKMKMYQMIQSKLGIKFK
jgi:hypothetical protein